MADSFLDNGFLLNKSPGQNQPRRVENARVLLANTAMDTDKIKVFGSRVRTNDIKSLAEIEQAEKDKMKEKVEKICKYDMNVFINRQLIYNYPEQVCNHQDPDGKIENSAKSIVKNCEKLFLYFSQLVHGSVLAKSQPLPLVDS